MGLGRVPRPGVAVDGSWVFEVDYRKNQGEAHMQGKRWATGAVLGMLLLGAAPSSWAQAQGPYQFHSVSPCRLVDTRLSGQVTGQYGPVLTSGVERKFPVQGACGVPVGAKAATVNLTAVAPSGQGRLTMYPSGIATPTTSNINYPAGTTALANGAIVPLADQAVQAYDVAIMPFLVGGGTVHVVLDVTGYFQ